MLVMAKSAALYRSRIGNSVSLLLLGVVFALVYHFAGLRGIGPLVYSVAGILMIICLFIGVQLTADSIAQEKREGTLGLLLLTPLTPFQIVLGKLIAHSLSAFYWMLIAVPLLSLMLIVGGIQGRDLGMLVLTALNTLFFSAAVGLFVSTRHTERKKAAVAGTWIILFFWLGVPFLVFLTQQLAAPGWVRKALELTAILGGYEVTVGPRPPSMGPAWQGLLCNHFMGWIFVGLATMSLRRNWQDVPAKNRFSLRQWWKGLSLGKPAVRLRLRQKLLDQNPFFWLASRDRLRVAPVWIMTAVILVVMIFFLTYSGAPSPAIVLVLTLVIGMVHRGAAAGLSAYQLQIEHEQGTLEMLTSTPLTVGKIIRGQRLASRRQLAALVALVLLLHAAGFTLLLVWAGSNTVDPPIVFALFAHAYSYLFDLYALTWTGMWCATIVSDPKNAAGAAMARIVAVPILAVMCVVATGSIARFYGWASFSPSYGKFVVMWLLFATANNIYWVSYVRRRLPEQLKAFAVKRYNREEPIGLFGKLGRALGKLQRPKQPPIINPVPGGV
jgi:ABC-type transport system involved in multi-copper enzyme maturation permease subunit